MSLRIIDLIRMPELRTRMICGERGLERPIRWAHVCELSDPTEWLGESDLLMTTGIGIPADQPSQAHYIESLSKAGLSGLMIGEHMRAPKNLRVLQETAHRLGFPLLLTHYGVPFASVTRAVVDANRKEEFVRGNAVTRIYVSGRMAIGGLDMPSLRRRLEADANAKLLMLQADTLQPWFAGSQGLSEVDREQLLLQRTQDLNSQLLVRRYMLSGAEVLGIAVPSDQACLLLAFRHQGSALDYGVLHHVSAVLGIALERTRFESERRLRIGSELLDDLLNCRLSFAHADKQLQRFGLELGSAQLAVARTSVQPLAHWAAQFERAALPVLFRSQGDELLLLLPNDTATTAQTLLNTPIGLSDRIASTERLPEAIQEARLALAYADEGQPIVMYAQAANKLPWLPRDLNEAAQTYRRILGRLAAHDEESSTPLLYTLKVFLEKNRSWQAAATRLHIHKTTLNYRIRRIEALTGRSLDKTEDVAVLWLALQAADVLGDQIRSIKQEPL